MKGTLRELTCSRNMKARMAAASSAKKMSRMSMKNCKKTTEKKGGVRKRVGQGGRERARHLVQITFRLCPLHSALIMQQARDTKAHRRVFCSFGFQFQV